MLQSVKIQPNAHTIGTTPTGGMFLTAQYFIRRGNVALTTVPFGGAGPALTAVLGGHIDSVWAPLAAAESHVRAGTVKVLAVSGPGRTSGHPDIPSFSELGVDAPHVQWIGVVGPKGISADRLKFLRDAFVRITKDPEYQKAATKLGIDVAYGTAEEFERQVREEDRAFKTLVQDLGLTPK
jgi:tripartite-type tricarboxylate transporter receptor subunit TctC